MARKRSSSDGGISLDSLMDALTNVVAVLILVLILVQADVSQKVQKFIDDLPPATPEDIAQNKKLIEELQRKQALIDTRLNEKPATPEDIEEEKRQIALLEKSTQETTQLLTNLEQLRELEIKIRTELEAEKEKTLTIQKEIAEIEGLLDTIKPTTPEAPTVVNIPNSRVIPKKAITYHAIVIKNRLHFIDSNRILEIIRNELKKNKKNLLYEKVDREGQPDLLVYDPEKIAAHFKNFNWGDTRGQIIEIQVNPYHNHMTFIIRPNLETGGSQQEELSKPNGEFAKAITIIRNNKESVLLYRVNPDSFDTYLSARDLSEKINIPAGWEMHEAGQFWDAIPDLFVKRLEDPPPPKENQPPKPPGPPGPPPLKPKLD